MEPFEGNLYPRQSSAVPSASFQLHFNRINNGKSSHSHPKPLSWHFLLRSPAQDQEGPSVLVLAGVDLRLFTLCLTSQIHKVGIPTQYTEKEAPKSSDTKPQNPWAEALQQHKVVLLVYSQILLHPPHAAEIPEHKTHEKSRFTGQIPHASPIYLQLSECLDL